ncbi:MAG: non-homologous end-joining DNA ligase [Balneolaceae bacterium]
MEVESQQVEIKNREKVFFPEYGITKGDLIDYYERISDYILPFLENRPLSLRRYPDGITTKGFFQKEVPDYFPNWIETTEVEKKEGGTIRQVLCNNKATLIYLVNQGTLSMHPWLSRLPELNKPDHLVFDLDPPDHNFKPVIEGTRILKKILDELGVPAFIMTSGGKGLHIVCPLKPVSGFDTVRSFAKKTAQYAAGKDPDSFTTEVRKDERKNRVFIDYLRNGYAQTSIAPYSARAQQNATVATPLAWDELNKNGLTSGYYHIKNIFRRLNQIEDPWKEFYSKACYLENFIPKLDKLADKS